ncbi:hypothetical protein PT2222_140089 [Paraburkholderia tropica]
MKFICYVLGLDYFKANKLLSHCVNKVIFIIYN